MTKPKHKVPCRCGHAKVNHIWRLWETRFWVCGVEKCDCEDYKADNLKYLEEEYDKRNS